MVVVLMESSGETCAVVMTVVGEVGEEEYVQHELVVARQEDAAPVSAV